MLMIDLVLNLDSLFLKDGETVDDLVEYLKKKYEFGYEPIYEVTYEEIIDD